MTSINQTKESKQEPARPILASHLLDLEEKQRKLFINVDRKLRTACTDVDELFGGNGVERGVVLGISGEGEEGRLISLQLLASVLLSHLSRPSNTSSSTAISKAVVIDTTGSFPLSLLAKILKARIQEAREAATTRNVQTGNFATSIERRTAAASEEDVTADVQRCLEMVALSRVFDVEGLWEVLGEGGRPAQNAVTTKKQGPREVVDSTPKDVAGRTNEVEECVINIPEVGDSDEEILTSEPPSPLPEEAYTHDEDESVEIIIIDNMTHIINELFTRKERGEAHNLLTLLSSTIYTMTRTQNILTILHNSTVPARSKSTSLQNQNPNTTTIPQIQQPTSLFPSNPVKPALGQIFTQFISLHIFISQLPKGREDAEALYGGDEYGYGGNDMSDVDYCTVVEVLKDECPIIDYDHEKDKTVGVMQFGWREGNWCAVKSTADGLRLKTAFEEKGARRGLKMEANRRSDIDTGGTVESRVGLGVGNIAKIYGFGGRRV